MNPADTLAPVGAFCPPRFGTPRDPSFQTLGAGVGKLAQAIWGQPLMKWQQHVVDVAMEIDSDGCYRYPAVVCVVPRRAGKTRLTQAVSIHRATRPGSFSWYTAQDGKNAAEKFRLELLPTLMASPLGPYLSPRTAAGNERVSIAGGGTMKLFAPTAEQVHGFDGDMVCVDEAWAFTMARGQELEAAARPIGLTRFGHFQFWVVSAGGDESSTWLDHWMTLGRAGTPGIAYFEWSADSDLPDYDPYDPDLIARTHPSVTEGHIAVEAILGDRHTMDRAVYERSYLGVWPRPSELVQHKVDPERWEAGADPEAQADASPLVCIAVDIAQDRGSAAVVAAGRTGLEVTLEVIQAAPGTAWVVPLLTQLHRARPGVPLVMDALSAATVAAELKRARIPVQTTGASDMARACHVLADLVNAGHLTHRPFHQLDTAVRTAGTRKLTDGWAWSRAGSHQDISALVAATLAVWGAITAETPVKPSIATA